MCVYAVPKPGADHSPSGRCRPRRERGQLHSWTRRRPASGLGFLMFRLRRVVWGSCGSVPSPGLQGRPAGPRGSRLSAAGSARVSPDKSMTSGEGELGVTGSPKCSQRRRWWSAGGRGIQPSTAAGRPSFLALCSGKGPPLGESLSRPRPGLWGRPAGLRGPAPRLLPWLFPPEPSGPLRGPPEADAVLAGWGRGGGTVEHVARWQSSLAWT